MVQVSVIMPAYNAEHYIADAIRSVLTQTFTSLELIIVNDGSEDKTKEVISSFNDPRIVIINQDVNRGVSIARNKGLSMMKGKYFCFLDADDFMPPHSVSSRVSLLENNNAVTFVDGVVLKKDLQLKKTLSTYSPSFRGNPRKELLKLSSRCFLGNTWMVRRNGTQQYSFQENLTHLEDYLFFLQLSVTGIYDYVSEEILWYRKNPHSAMGNIDSLEKGYRHVFKYIKANKLASKIELLYLKYRIARILFLSHLFDGKQIGKAFKSLINTFK